MRNIIIFFANVGILFHRYLLNSFKYSKYVYPILLLILKFKGGLREYTTKLEQSTNFRIIVIILKFVAVINIMLSGTILVSFSTIDLTGIDVLIDFYSYFLEKLYYYYQKLLRLLIDNLNKLLDEDVLIDNSLKNEPLNQVVENTTPDKPDKPDNPDPSGGYDRYFYPGIIIGIGIGTALGVYLYGDDINLYRNNRDRLYCPRIFLDQ